MYTEYNYKTKKHLKEDLKKGKRITVFQPGLGAVPAQNGTISLEGQHGIHKWYARGTLKNGVLVAIK